MTKFDSASNTVTRVDHSVLGPRPLTQYHRDDNQWHVESIIGHCVVRGRTQYFISWLGTWSADMKTSWVDQDDISDDAIEGYNHSRPLQYVEDEDDDDDVEMSSEDDSVSEDDDDDSGSEYCPSEYGVNRRDINMSRAKGEKATQAHSLRRSRKSREESVAPVVTLKGETSDSQSSIDPSEASQADEVHGTYDESSEETIAESGNLTSMLQLSGSPFGTDELSSIPADLELPNEFYLSPSPPQAGEIISMHSPTASSAQLSPPEHDIAAQLQAFDQEFPQFMEVPVDNDQQFMSEFELAFNTFPDPVLDYQGDSEEDAEGSEISEGEQARYDAMFRQ